MWAGQHLAAGTHALSDGLQCFDATTEAGCAATEKPEFYRVSTVLGNLKTALRASCHSFEARCAPRHLAEFECRFNRRYHLADMVPRLAFVAPRTPPKHGSSQVVIRHAFIRIEKKLNLDKRGGAELCAMRCGLSGRAGSRHGLARSTIRLLPDHFDRVAIGREEIAMNLIRDVLKLWLGESWTMQVIVRYRMPL